MKSLSKAQMVERAQLMDRLREIAAEIEEKISEVNSIISNYNEVVAEVEEFRDGLVGEMQDYYDERSEKWQDGEKGSAYSDWKNEWEQLDTSQADEVEAPDLSLADNLENLPDEADSGW